MPEPLSLLASVGDAARTPAAQMIDATSWGASAGLPVAHDAMEDLGAHGTAGVHGTAGARSTDGAHGTARLRSASGNVHALTERAVPLVAPTLDHRLVGELPAVLARASRLTWRGRPYRPCRALRGVELSSSAVVRLRHLAAGGLAVLALLACSANAFADVEPNDTLVSAEGPISGGVELAGVLANTPDQEGVGDEDDVLGFADNDWYVFYVTGQTQLRLTSAAQNPNCLWVRLYDADGSELPDVIATLPGTHRYFVSVYPERNDDGGRVRCQSAQPYTFSLQPAGNVVGGEPMAAPSLLGEPNESAAQAGGPLVGGAWYGGAFETVNDKDYAFFYTAAGTQQVDISVASGTYCDGSYLGPFVTLVSPDANASEMRAKAKVDTVSHITFTSVTPARYVVYAAGKMGCSYQFRLDPPQALAPSLPAPPAQVPAPTPPPAPKVKVKKAPSKACTNAKKSKTRWTRKVATTNKQLKRTHRAKTKRKLRKRLAAEKRTLRRTSDKVLIYCR